MIVACAWCILGLVLLIGFAMSLVGPTEDERRLEAATARRAAARDAQRRHLRQPAAFPRTAPLADTPDPWAYGLNRTT